MTEAGQVRPKLRLPDPLNFPAGGQTSDNAVCVCCRIYSIVFFKIVEFILCIYKSFLVMDLIKVSKEDKGILCEFILPWSQFESL